MVVVVEFNSLIKIVISYGIIPGYNKEEVHIVDHQV